MHWITFVLMATGLATAVVTNMVYVIEADASELAELQAVHDPTLCKIIKMEIVGKYAVIELEGDREKVEQMLEDHHFFASKTKPKLHPNKKISTAVIEDVAGGRGKIKTTQNHDGQRLFTFPPPKRERKQSKVNSNDDSESSCRFNLIPPYDEYVNGHFGWGLDRSCKHWLPLDSEYCIPPYYGNNVTVHIVDTGIYPHETFYDGQVQYNYDYYGEGALDCNGHGTHVAGIVGSSVYGIATGVTLSSVRVLDCNGEGTIGSLISGLLWIYQFGTLRSIINMSLGTIGDDSTAVNQVIQDLVAMGCTLVASAGNDGENACNDYPANVPGVIAVGATNEVDDVCYFSNRGPCVDIWAPGRGIVSCYGSDDESQVLSGTSMSAPDVSGALAMIYQELEESGTTPNQDLATKILFARATRNVVSGLIPEENHNRFVYVGPKTSKEAKPNRGVVEGDLDDWYWSSASNDHLTIRNLLLNIFLISLLLFILWIM